MSYHLKGFGDASACGPGQTFYSNVTFGGVRGQCMTPAQYEDCKKGSIYGKPCIVNTAGGIVSSIVGALTSPVTKPSISPQLAPAARSGVSTTTVVAVGGAALLAAILLARR